MINENISIKGDVVITLTSEDGAIKQQEKANLVVQAGKDLLAEAIKAVITPFSYIAVGTGTNAAASGDTALQTELTRVTFSSSRTNNITTLTAVFSAGVGTGAITEAGILNAAVAGTLLSRVVFSVVNKASTDTLTITWSIQVG